MPARRVTLRIQPPNPFGEVTMVPATLRGRPEADAARAMAAAFADSEAASSTDVLNRLRHSFPLAPLSERVAALSVIMDRCPSRPYAPASNASTPAAMRSSI